MKLTDKLDKKSGDYIANENWKFPGKTDTIINVLGFLL